MAGIITMDSYNHTGIVVKDAEATAESWSRKLGAGPWKFTDGGPLKLAHGNIGEIQYELLEPLEGQGSLWADFLAERGEGLHHISHNVADVDAAAAKLVEDGGKIMVYGGNPIAIPKWMAYVEIGGPGSVILELLRTRE
ncbi:MAG: VOC family protein [Desulfobacterales bacterium]